VARPLRDVIKIEERSGPRGGGIWFLTLSCGHSSAVRRRAPSFENAVGALSGRLGMKDFFAPERSRCWICPPASALSDPKEIAKAIIAACVARGVDMIERDSDDVRFAAHEAYHAIDLDLETWDSDSIHGRIARLPHSAAALTEIEARAAEWIVCDRLVIKYELEKWAFLSFMESIKGLNLKLPTNISDLIRDKKDDPKVKRIAERILALA